MVKPKHSGFYSTTLDLLLKHLGAEVLILAGFTADICILFTAHDAYMRDLSFGDSGGLRGIARRNGKPTCAEIYGASIES